MSLDLIVPQQKRNQFRVWLCGCPHVKADDDMGRKSIMGSLNQMGDHEGLFPDCTIMVGDFSTSQTPAETPDAIQDPEGSEVVDQLTGGNRIRRKDIYTSRGNHDAGQLEYNWFNKYVDIFGENTVSSSVNINNYPFEIIRDGSSRDHYAFKNGNVLFLVLNDRNDVAAPVGRDTPASTGGYPSGAITRDTWNWIKSMVADNPNKIIIVTNHHVLKETTIASGDDEGIDGGYHGASGILVGTGRVESIYNVGLDTYVDSTEIITYLNANQGDIFAWIGAHTHHNVDEVYVGRGSYILKYGTHFLNTGALSIHHTAPQKDAHSRYLVFQDNSDQLEVLQYIHDSSTKDEGFFRANDLTLTLPFKFQL